MSALFQSVASQLGNLGGSYATARDTQTESRNQAAVQQFDMAQKLRDYLEQQKMDDLAAQVQQANLARQQAGTWDTVGQPMQTRDGGYAVVERNSVTGDIRTRPLPADVTPRNKDEVDWDQFRNAYKQAFNTEPSDDYKKAFFNKLAGVSAPKLDDFTAWLAAFPRQYGREPNAEDIARFHRDPKAATDVSNDALDNMAEAVASNRTKLPSGKLGVQVLNQMQKLGLNLPTQLSYAQQLNFKSQADALVNAIDTIDRIQPNLSILRSLPTASMVELGQYNDTIANLLSRMISKKYDSQGNPTGDYNRIVQLTADLRSFQEQVNTLRKLVNSTGFRSTEAWKALQAQGVTPLGNPDTNAKVIKTTRAALQSMLDSTLSTLGGSPDGANVAPTATPPPGAVVKTYNPATGKVE